MIQIGVVSVGSPRAAFSSRPCTAPPCRVRARNGSRSALVPLQGRLQRPCPRSDPQVAVLAVLPAVLAGIAAHQLVLVDRAPRQGEARLAAGERAPVLRAPGPERVARADQRAR